MLTANSYGAAPTRSTMRSTVRPWARNRPVQTWNLPSRARRSSNSESGSPTAECSWATSTRSSAPLPGSTERSSKAIAAAIEGQAERTIESRDGREYPASELIENWELDEELLACYARPTDHPDYEHDSHG